MKKCYIIFFLLLPIPFSVDAAQKISGQIVYADRTVDVMFLVRATLLGDLDLVTMQQRVRYLDAKGKKQYIYPKQAKELRFPFQGRDYRLISKMNGSTAENNIFLSLLTPGPVSLYEYQYIVYGYSGRTSTNSRIDSFLLQKGDGKLEEPNKIGFRKEMATYFSDCPALVELIQGRDFKRRDMEEIVAYYNSKCAIGGTN